MKPIYVFAIVALVLSGFVTWQLLRIGGSSK